MKVVAINGSPRVGGNTHFAITEMGAELQKENIEFSEIQIGGEHIRGCMTCGRCSENKNEKCNFVDDKVNELLPLLKQADGIILAVPVYYSGIAGTMKCFLDRVFCVAQVNGNIFNHKIGVSIVAVRRTGGSITVNSLNNYLQEAGMIIPSSNSLNIIYGRDIGDAQNDEKGIEIMRTLAKNMAWLLKKD
ncbi:MAG: flavodoxin family protein [Bacteroidales bacterium]|jgi:multimeric flavodoxin WrbA|nr:flavodoxin family protein [Bacteroidales bacterium]